MKRIPLLEIPVQRGLGVIPRPEVVELAWILCGHTPAAWANKGKPGRGFAGLLGLADVVD